MFYFSNFYIIIIFRQNFYIIVALLILFSNIDLAKVIPRYMEVHYSTCSYFLLYIAGKRLSFLIRFIK